MKRVPSWVWWATAGLGSAWLLTSVDWESVGDTVTTLAAIDQTSTDRLDDLDYLSDDFRPLAEELIARVESRLGSGAVWIYETGRSAARQAMYIAQGTSTVEVSRHQLGEAIDLIDGRTIDSGPYKGKTVGWGSWGDDRSAELADEFFSVLGEEAEALGLEWGGSWSSFNDKPHVQLD